MLFGNGARVELWVLGGMCSPDIAAIEITAERRTRTERVSAHGAFVVEALTDEPHVSERSMPTWDEVGIHVIDLTERINSFGFVGPYVATFGLAYRFLFETDLPHSAIESSGAMVGQACYPAGSCTASFRRSSGR
jgi:hypothetical protein